ncbi:MAG: hypothetical protein ACT4PY_07795 [Armatimonadota bacterium]
MTCMSLLFVIFVLVLDTGALLAQEHDYLVDGKRFGKWTLGATEQDLLRIFREMFGSQFRMAPTITLSGGRFYFWYDSGFQFNAFQGRVVAIAIWRRRNAADAELMKYRTKEDVRLGEPLGKVIAAYGLPDRQWIDRVDTSFTYTAMVWERLGLFIGVRNNEVEVLAVYDPSLAWSWKQ